MLSLRSATMDDATRLYVWRTHKSTRAMMRDTGEIRWEDHVDWLQKALVSPKTILVIGCADSTPVGTARLDRDGDSAEISVTVAPECRGGGIGAEIITRATAWGFTVYNLTTITARIKTENVASQKAFTKAGYTVLSQSEGEVIMSAQR